MCVEIKLSCNLALYFDFFYELRYFQNFAYISLLNHEVAFYQNKKNDAYLGFIPKIFF